MRNYSFNLLGGTFGSSDTWSLWVAQFASSEEERSLFSVDYFEGVWYVDLLWFNIIVGYGGV